MKIVRGILVINGWPVLYLLEIHSCLSNVVAKTVTSQTTALSRKRSSYHAPTCAIQLDSGSTLEQIEPNRFGNSEQTTCSKLLLQIQGRSCREFPGIAKSAYIITCGWGVKT